MVFEVVRLAGDSINASIRMWGANLYRNPADVDAEVEFVYRDQASTGLLWRRTITESTDIEEMLTEIRETIQLFLFVNQSQQVSGRLYEHDSAATAETLTDDEHLIAESVSISHDHEDRVTRVVLAYALTAGTDPEDIANYTVDLHIDLDSEDRIYYGGDFREKRILSQWIPAADTFSAGYFGPRILGRYKHGTRTISGRLEIKDDDIEIGDYIIVDTEQISDAFGVNLAPVAIMTKKQETAGNQIEFEALIVEDFWEVS